MKKLTALLLLAVMILGTLIAPTSAFAADTAENYPLNSIVIKVEDIVTHTMLGGARFEVYYSNDAQSGGYGTLVATVDSDGSGVIVLSGIPSGYYIVRQTVPSNNYHLSINNEQHCFIKADGTSIEELVFSNYRYDSLVVILNDKDTGAPVPGATFSVTDVNGGAVGATADGIYTTDIRGEFYLENLPAGSYKITQLTAAQGYAMDSSPSTRTVRLQHTSADYNAFTAAFSNSPLGTLLVRLKDSITKEPLAGAVFNVRLSGGADLGEFTTEADGSFSLPKIARGSYIVSQISAPAGYLLATTAKTQYVNYVDTFAVDFENQPKSGLYVTKYDKDTKEPLRDAKFRVYQDSTLVGTFTTNANGSFFVPNLDPGWYSVEEYAAPQGYILNDTPKSVQVIAETLHRLEFENSRLASLQIVKTDEYNGEPLAGARFRVTTQNGEFVGDVSTDASGKAVIPSLQPGWYVISETKAPVGYLVTEAARTVEVKSTVPTVVTITNRAENNLEIVKLDLFSRTPLSGATFKVEHANGKFVGTFRTDSGGKILVGSLEEGAYVVSEIAAPDGYQLDSEPQTITIEGGKLHSVEFLDKPLSGIEIIKTDSVTHNPLSGATFTVEKDTGERIGTYKTDAAGKALVTGLDSGTYVVSETIAPDGYILNEIPKTVVVTSGKLTVAEFENKPFSGIQILKTDSESNAPLQGAVFTIQRVNGERVGDKYTTDVAGKIVVPDLSEGVYIISEVTAPSEYILDAQPQTVEVKTGRLTIAEFVNKPYPFLIIQKIDASSGALVAGARFTVTNANGVVIANVTSLATGPVSIKVAPGIYTITETHAPDGYELNDPVQTVEVKADGGSFVSGGTVAPGGGVSFENRPLNTIEIVKLDSVTHNPLSGALFSVTKANGESVGSYRTDSAGKILIPEVTEGTYVISETAAPQGYILSESPKSVNVSGGNLFTVEFLNKPLSGIEIVKLDAVTRQPLANAEFTVTKADGERIGIFRTEADGKILISDLDEGVYVIGEVSAPSGYQLDASPKNVTVTSGKLAAVEFINKPLSGIEIVKLDAVTQQPLQGAEFTVTKADGERVGTFRTEADGKVLVFDLDEGVYVVGEISAPDGYQLDESPTNVTVTSGKLATVEFTNKPLSGIEIVKTDAVTHEPLSGATFEVKHSDGETVGTYKTDVAGKAVVSGLTEGTYIVSETIAPDGYVLDNVPQTVTVRTGKLTAVEFVNKPFAGIEIRKVDEISGNALPGAVFEIRKQGGEYVTTLTTDSNGSASVASIEPGWYVITETKAPEGYVIDGAAKTVEVKTGVPTVVTVSNKPLSGIEVLKLDAITKAPLMGAAFTLERDNGEKIGSYTTDSAGKIIISGLTEGTYIVSETAAPEGYILDDVPQTVLVKSGKLTAVEFTNKPLSGIEVIKLDAKTKAPLMGASFTVEKDTGERVGTYQTDSTGKFVVSGLAEGTYIVSETAAPEGYILDAQPQTVIVKSGKLTIAEFTNKPLSGLKIIKLASDTRNPIEGVEFAVSKMDGERVENDFRANSFKTDRTGQIFIPQLEDGYYTVTETRAADGYIIDGEPKTVLVQSGKTTLLEVFNTPMSGLLIVKTDKNTGKPLEGVVFDVTHADGQFVAGSILDGNQPGTLENSPNKTTSPNGDITGSYTTDRSGRILINGLEAGQYNVTERKALDGYEIDADVHSVTVTPGKLVTMQLTNTPKAGLRIVKIDSVTKKPIFGVEFMLFDSNNLVVGTYKTDNNGVIDFTGIIEEGRYTIRETKAAAGYYLDETPKTVEFIAGKVTEIRWENVPEMAQIQITKLSGDDNEVNGLPAGSLLEGAVFETYDYKTGNLIDRFVSGSDGRAVSKALPLGRYVIKEVQAPQWYKVSDRQLDVDLEFATQIVKLEYLNYSANTGVYIKKAGNAEAMSGDVIPYTIKSVQNTGTVPLSDFYWRDTLPVDAVRLNKIVTGTFNQALKYKILATTNKGDQIIIADNLSTTMNNAVDCSNASLGLMNDEYVTSVTFVFGTVRAGFAQVECPQIYVKVQPNLPNGYQFANKADIGGKYGSEWVVSNSTTVTSVYSTGKLPRTGY